MKNILPSAALAVVFFITANQVTAQHQLEKKWESEASLKVPESVLFDAGNKVLYVSNIDGQPDGKDGKGSIGKLGLDGKIIMADWVSGLSAPKGMALVKKTLWVADVDEVVAIDIATGKIKTRVQVPGSKFLNDVAADEKGNIYVSDSQTKMVHKIEKGKSSEYLSGLAGPNGLLVYKKSLYVLDNGGLYKVETDKKLTKLADGMEGNTDGLEPVGNGDFIVSCWEGSIFYVKADGTKEHLLDTRADKINSADIGYDAANKIVYVPTFFKNSVVAYQLK